VITEFHFIRPFWLLALLPLLLVAWRLLRQIPLLDAWSEVCDPHLLPYLMQMNGRSKRTLSVLLLLSSAACMVMGLAGPTWSRLPVPTYQTIQPRVVVLDLSDSMLMNDLLPNRISRAKFKLHDLFQYQHAGQFGLVVYTGEPFVVSPLTDDAQTIDALLTSLTPDIMPVKGNRLDYALEQAKKLITQAGFVQGDVLVLTAEVPSVKAVTIAKTLAKEGIYTSVMPILGNQSSGLLFQPLANSGHGKLISFSDTSSDLKQWLAATKLHQTFGTHSQDDIPMWRDEGRWFLIPSLLFMLPVFRRGWLQRMNS